MENTYYKFAPNVYLAKCTESHEKGDIITVTTQYWKENECIVHNQIPSKGEYFYYSITASDWTNSQDRAQRKAEKLQGYAQNAESKSNSYYEASNEWRDFLALAEPIKIGHHSEKKHRALIERNHNRMDKSMELAEKAGDYNSRAEYWESKATEINLSMPESIEYYTKKLQQAELKHKLLKEKPELRAHSYSLTYATKEKKDAQKNLELAQKLWA